HGAVDVEAAVPVAPICWPRVDQQPSARAVRTAELEPRMELEPQMADEQSIVATPLQSPEQSRRIHRRRRYGEGRSRGIASSDRRRYRPAFDNEDLFLFQSPWRRRA